MKVKITCEIEADIVDKEELESIKEHIDSKRSLKPIGHIWRTILGKALKGVCPTPVYDNKKLNVEVEYKE